MIDPKKLDGLATFCAGYLKRWLEGNLYDRIFKTEFGEKLKSFDKKTRYGIEFGLNLLTTFFDQKLAEDTALKKFVKEVGIDIGPEISKRLINNTTTQKEKELVSVLLELEDQTLIELLNWLYDIEPTERAKVLKHLSQLSVDDLVRLTQLPLENRKKLFDILKPQVKVKEKKSFISPAVVQEIEKATKKVEEIRKKLHVKRRRG